MPHHRPQGRPRSRLPLLGGLALLALALSGCNPNAPMYVLNTDAALATMITGLFLPIIWIAVAVFVLVEGGLLYAMIKFRRRPGQGLPAQTHGNTTLEITWTIIPTVILAVIAIPTVAVIFDAANTDDRPGEKIHIRVIGHQWWWEFEYPELGIVTANEFHMPTGTTAVFDITSYDVIHSFWVPRLGGKRDALPGHINKIWYHSDKPGLYYGQCTEYCGDSHANMRIRAIVQTPAEFEEWVKLQKAAPPPPSGDAAVGQSVFRSKCISCHAIQGVSTIQRVASPDPKKIYGPDLTHVGGRTSIGSGMFENTPKTMADWIRDPQGVKPGSKMVVPAPALHENEVQALAAYLTSLK